MLGLFRKKSLTEVMAEADALFAAQSWGEAKLAYDRVEERARKTEPDVARKAAEQAATCCDQIAGARIAAAQEFARDGHLDLAREELLHALETARSNEVVARVREAQDGLEQRDAVKQAHLAVPEISEEERIALIVGSWEGLQAEELESYGDGLLRGLLALEYGKPDDALDLLLPLCEQHPDASYLWLEVGRAQLAGGAIAEAESALRRFLSRIGPEEGGDARLNAHRELSRIAHERGESEAAIAELEACAGALEDDPRPYLDLGSYLRSLGRPGDALEVLELSEGLFPDGKVEWPVTLEIGLACADLGEKQRAERALESVVETLSSLGLSDLPPMLVVPLAKLCEDAGNLTRAADLYRTLTQGSDRQNHQLYYRETARLLRELGLDEEAQRMTTRSEALETAPSGAGEAKIR